ncbi:hypothetical protein SmJEL517_g05871 [Synchytrium microbalum]|uniref:Amine oxidase domain-containing protein n=1 Tax=Synchytrium microbalum TaxID=1806994 RepID=A0A507BXY5_9FUNG|nr:uncharacterized protein SmJEL517_g05871 [Synchytrium microbalum]TPX30586.1 hypothetical protein SmJEL517_g05871 [Synchytrium microbalum]
MVHRIAVVGSGISGLSAAYLLARQPEKFQVVVYEEGEWIGGHTHTVEIESLYDPKLKAPVDTGFIVCNPHTYPNLLNFLKQLNVELTDSNMSFAVSKDKGVFEWAGDNIDTVFAQRSNLFSLNMWRMIWDTIRFDEQATDIAEQVDQDMYDEAGKMRADADTFVKGHPYAHMTLAEFFTKYNYSKFFYESYIVPMTASVWSAPADMALDQFPLLTLVRFMRNHMLLQVTDRPTWRTVLNGSKSYVNKILETVKDVRLNTAVTSITRSKDKNSTHPRTITINDSRGGSEVFDHVILACHTDQALKILGPEATPDEQKIIGGIKYVRNRAVLHRDPSLMPVRRKTWSSWNYLLDSTKLNTMCLTYWMNRLQTFIPVQEFGDVFVTMNPMWEPKGPVLGEWYYDHPYYCNETIMSQETLNKIQGLYCTTYCGAWTNYGFHEDGLTSGLLAALSLGATSPFPVVLNGGYPTHRLAPTPPAWAKIPRYEPAPPIHLGKRAKREFTSFVQVAPLMMWGTVGLSLLAGLYIGSRIV